MADEKVLDFLRVLIAAAWADGEITYHELNNLKAYFRELDLDDEQVSELEPYLADPIGPDEARTIVDDFLSQARRSEREALIAAVRDLVLADGVLDGGEKAFLDMLDTARAETTTASVFVAQLKRLWGHAKPSTETVRRSDLIGEFVRNRVLYQVKRRLLLHGGAGDVHNLDADTERELRYVCALAGLLGHVAGTDRAFDADERATISEILDALSSLQHRDVDIIVDIVESEVLSDIGYFPFARELNDLATPEERGQVLTLLFDVAAADGEIIHEELEEIRKISKALHIDHQRFIAAKLAAQAGTDF